MITFWCERTTGNHMKYGIARSCTYAVTCLLNCTGMCLPLQFSAEVTHVLSPSECLFASVLLASPAWDSRGREHV